MQVILGKTHGPRVSEMYWFVPNWIVMFIDGCSQFQACLLFGCVLFHKYVGLSQATAQVPSKTTHSRKRWAITWRVSPCCNCASLGLIAIIARSCYAYFVFVCFLVYDMIWYDTQTHTHISYLIYIHIIYSIIRCCLILCYFLYCRCCSRGGFHDVRAIAKLALPYLSHDSSQIIPDDARTLSYSHALQLATVSMYYVNYSWTVGLFST